MNFFVFTDEAGAYKRNPSNAHIKSHPFYIRSNVLMSINDYRKYQIEMLQIRKEYGLALNDEIKWSDIGRKARNNPRNDFIAKMSIEKLGEYYRKSLEKAIDKESICFMFTVTNLIDRQCWWGNESIYKGHLQDAFQRIQMDMRSDNGFAVFVMDEMNDAAIKQIKAVCYEFSVNGDFVKYNNLYHGVLVENSLYSPGIQLADYAAGILNGYLKGKIVSPGKYHFATNLYEEFIKPHLRRKYNRPIVGYGVISIPCRSQFRSKLEAIFNLDNRATN